MSTTFQTGAFQGDAFQIGALPTGGASSFTITVNSSAITLTGSAALVKGAFVVAATTSAVTLTGSSANLKVGRAVTVVSSAVTLTGSSVAIAASRPLTVNSSAVNLTGSNVSFSAGRAIAATSAAVTLTGSSVLVTAGRLVGATTAAVTLTGSSVDITVTPAGGVSLTLTVDSGTITLTGTSVTLTAVIAVNDNVLVGGGVWRGPREPEYRVSTEYDGKPKKNRKRIVIGNQVVFADDPVIQTGIIEVRPAWDAMVELQQQRDEAERARLERLRAIALADDEWLMVA